MLCACTLLYVAGGSAVMVRQGAVSGTNHPHIKQWQQLRGLVVDGMRFSRARAQGKDGGAWVDGTLSTGLLHAPTGTGEENNRSVKDKHSNSTTPKAKRSKSAGKSAHKAETSPFATTEPSPPPDLGGAGTPADAGTAAGDGGRWVHVPS